MYLDPLSKVVDPTLLEYGSLIQNPCKPKLPEYHYKTTSKTGAHTSDPLKQARDPCGRPTEISWTLGRAFWLFRLESVPDAQNMVSGTQSFGLPPLTVGYIVPLLYEPNMHWQLNYKSLYYSLRIPLFLRTLAYSEGLATSLAWAPSRYSCTLSSARLHQNCTGEYRFMQQLL